MAGCMPLKRSADGGPLSFEEFLVEYGKSMRTDPSSSFQPNFGTPSNTNLHPAAVNQTTSGAGELETWRASFPSVEHPPKLTNQELFAEFIKRFGNPGSAAQFLADNNNMQQFPNAPSPHKPQGHHMESWQSSPQSNTGANPALSLPPFPPNPGISSRVQYPPYSNPEFNSGNSAPLLGDAQLNKPEEMFKLFLEFMTHMQKRQSNGLSHGGSSLPPDTPHPPVVPPKSAYLSPSAATPGYPKVPHTSSRYESWLSPSGGHVSNITPSPTRPIESMHNASPHRSFRAPSNPPLPVPPRTSIPPFQPINPGQSSNPVPVEKVLPFVPNFPPPPVMPDEFQKIFQSVVKSEPGFSPDENRAPLLKWPREPRKFSDPPFKRPVTQGANVAVIRRTIVNENARCSQKYSCDACGRYFWSKPDFDNHMADRVNCPHPGCSFSGHEDTVEQHFANTHARGFHIKLDTPEEIAKWRQERKAKFPSHDNIQKRREEERARLSRGEALSTRTYSNRRLNTRGDPGTAAGRDPGTGANQVALGDKSAKPDVKTENLNSSQRQPPYVQLTSRQKYLSKFMRPGDAPPRIKAEVAEQEEEEDDSDSGPEEAPIARHVTQPPVPPHPAQSVQPGQRRGRGGGGRRATLLEMLLAPDIRHERNVLLQCMRHIEHNKFFQP